MRRLRALKEFVQRGRRGWADGDCWDMFTYLGPLIADMIVHLRDNSWSFACVHIHETDDHDARMRHRKEGCNPQDWVDMLTRIEYGIRYYDYWREELDWQYFSVEERQRREQVAQEAVETAFNLLGKWWGAMWI